MWRWAKLFHKNAICTVTAFHWEPHFRLVCCPSMGERLDLSAELSHCVTNELANKRIGKHSEWTSTASHPRAWRITLPWVFLWFSSMPILYVMVLKWLDISFSSLWRNRYLDVCSERAGRGRKGWGMDWFLWKTRLGDMFIYLLHLQNPICHILSNNIWFFLSVNVFAVSLKYYAQQFQTRYNIFVHGKYGYETMCGIYQCWGI